MPLKFTPNKDQFLLSYCCWYKNLRDGCEEVFWVVDILDESLQNIKVKDST